MAASNSSPAPFLTYLTVFKARLGATNLVTRQATWGFTPVETLERQLRGLLSQRIDIDLTDKSGRVFADYLRKKKLIGEKQQGKGRYSEWTWDRSGSGVVQHRGVSTNVLSIYKTDIWFADHRMKSTIGVPTPDNVGEVIELAQQLRLITRAKNSVTAAGHLVAVSREHFPQSPPDNPFVLGLEAVGLLRQVISEDGLVMTEILKAAVELGQAFSRDDIAQRLPNLVGVAQRRAQQLKYSPPVLAEGKKFVELLKQTAAKFEGKSGGPGVLEHRTAPRLEWLTDFGAFSKEGLSKNGFAYRPTTDAGLLAGLIENSIGSAFGAEDAAHQYWTKARIYSDLRKDMKAPTNFHAALLRAYSLLRRPVGPAPLREVSFLALMLLGNSANTMELALKDAVDWGAGERAITLSGGRYSRMPEFVHIAPSFLQANQC